jgi:hypothetical protein
MALRPGDLNPLVCVMAGAGGRRPTRGGARVSSYQIQKAAPKGWPVYVRVRGQSRRSVDTRNRCGHDYCTSVFGQNKTFPAIPRRSQLPQLRTFVYSSRTLSTGQAQYKAATRRPPLLLLCNSVYAFLRRMKPSPANPTLSKARTAGSGTPTIGGWVPLRVPIPNWASKGVAGTVPLKVKCTS